MLLHSAAESIDPAQGYNGSILYLNPSIYSEPVERTEPPGLIIAEGNTVQEGYLKQLIRLLNLARPYPAVDYTASMLSNELSISEPIIVKPPKQRVLASMKVRLSSKDFRRRLPRPVILP